MNKIQIKLENCYGIRSFDHKFDFTLKNGKAHMIYAPNGSMKSSFARTFKTLSNGEDPKDLVYPQRVSTWLVKDADTQVDLDKDSLYVISSQISGRESEQMSLLLVHEDLRSRYDKIYEDVRTKKEELISFLQSQSGLKKDCERVLSEGFSDSIEALFSMEEETASFQDPGLSGIKYVDVINDHTLKLLDDPTFVAKLNDYIKTYESLISQSVFFKRGVFNHANAEDVAKELTKSNFFAAGHSVFLNTLTGKQEISSSTGLENEIAREKQAILQDATLRKQFEDLDKKFKNEGVKKLRDILDNNPFVTVLLGDIQNIKRLFWVSYLQTNYSNYTAFLSFYRSSKDEIESIVQEAKSEITQWSKVVKQFKERFHVPFDVSIGNQEDVMLKQQAPVLQFTFCDDNGTPVKVSGNLLGLTGDPDTAILSTGERRALYILNIIFDIEGKKLLNTQHLIIVDDIADSFDYKNKYAIVEYLGEISNYKDFRVIILTHNYDFFRTCQKRLDLHRKSCMQAEKLPAGITLIETDYMNKVPLELWVHKMHSPVERIAVIPFVRNLIQYKTHNYNSDADFLFLTSLLHIKANTMSINMGDLKAVFSRHLITHQPIDFKNDDILLVVPEIYASALGIINSTSEIWKLEEKILLSIAIRLKAEEAMIKLILAKNPSFNVASITSVQTSALFNEYRKYYDRLIFNSVYEIFERVLLMTTENVHINAFMYEPIIDLGSAHLKKLYNEILSIPN